MHKAISQEMAYAVYFTVLKTVDLVSTMLD